jgi:predicted AAA+ superfamily ATPase
VIQSDVDGTNRSPSTNTVIAYLNGLERLFVIENQPTWSPALRSRSILRKTPKRHFIDPSIAVAALKTSPDGLLKDLNTLGFLFESLCIRDLRIYAQVLKGDVLHYQDNTGLEADAIIALHDGRWGAIEVKLGQKNVDEAAENLLKLKNRIDEEKSNPPSFLMVLTGNGYAYRRADGVFCVPIGCLKA